MKKVVSALCVAAVTVTAIADQAAWPFIVIRHTGTINNHPKVFEQLIDCHRRHSGACDEFWFAAGDREKPEIVAKVCENFARYRSLCEEVGIALSYQQGLTLGHGESHDGKPKPSEQPFSADVWQKDRDGKTMRFLCPRSPEVLAYERAYAKAVIGTANPASYWLDDDLRLGVSKPMGCFCDRCIAVFNAKTGGNWTRETLVARLFSKAEREPVRAAWLDFNAESLAVYAAAVREAADELKSPCRLAYQSVWADTTYTASSYRPLLEALSGREHRAVGIRPGAGFYTETDPRGMVKKCLSVAREAERCRDYGNLVASVCYEQETYPRHVLHKSPGAIMTECALALASGCDSISVYWYSQSAPEPIEEYDRFVRTLAEARPYFERLAESTRRTRLGGVARYLGSAALETADFDLRDNKDFDLACAGIPVTVAEAKPKVWYLTAKSRSAMTEADKALLAKGGVVKVDDIEKYPLASRRTKLLDDLDKVTGGNFPVRIDAIRPIRILPRVLPDGRLDSVTILNLSIGDTDELKVRVRNPASETAFWQGAKQGLSSIALERGAAANERVVTIPNLAGWQIVTIFFTSAENVVPLELRVGPVDGDATAMLQNAFDKCFRAGGGTVTVEKGEYAVKGLRLRSNTTLLLKSGAVLKSSRNCDDYDILSGDGVEPVPEGSFAPGVVWVRAKDRKTNDHLLKCASRWNNGIIRILGARNVRIIGEPGSAIDGCDSYDPIGEEHFRGAHGISVHDSTNLVFRGYTIRNTGNWAHNIWRCADLTFEGLSILGGHDGIHFSTCDRVAISDCTMKTGDDCVAGFDNEDVTVRGCRFNTACSAFRFGGRRVLIEDCRCWGPGEYPIRNSLPKADQIAGAHGAPGAGRRTMLALFTYYSDFTIKVRHTPGDITVRNCSIDNSERFLHYNFSGNEIWQKNRPLESIVFDNVTAQRMGMSLCAYGDDAVKFSFEMKNCRISFAEPQREFIRAAHVGRLRLDGVSVEGVDGACVRSWGDVAEPETTNLKGISPVTVRADVPFKTRPI